MLLFYYAQLDFRVFDVSFELGTGNLQPGTGIEMEPGTGTRTGNWNLNPETGNQNWEPDLED